jgi:hypothetical protein
MHDNLFIDVILLVLCMITLLVDATLIVLCMITLFIDVTLLGVLHQ